uniref:F-actin monooxygenase n=1 Tax=Oncorhynchus mykiss TaxID=8022 RepID=A0A8C7R5D4_ONCMY
MGEKEDERSAQAGQLFENFVQASTCKGTLQAFSILCRQMDLDPLDYRNFYSNLKATVTNWKAKALWTKLDKRAGHKEYKKAKACEGTRSLIIGGGPCGLRTAIELALLGAKVVVIEKRDTFSRNNVLHLWPYTIHDLRGLGAKKFYGKFCAGAIDHISIRQLQLMLLKVSLIVGVEVHVNVEFVKLLEPLDNQENEGLGWRAEIRPSNHPLTDYEFDVVIGADGRRNTLDGFKRKEFRGKLAIAITANFVNRNTTAEAKVEEISGVAFIFNQKFFLELKEETGIDLENIVYYRDNTHYFVMTAKKQSLLDKGVIIHDYIETEKLLGQDNVNQEALLSYAREAADFGTNYQLPSLDYAINHCNQPDVAMFDFTCMCASENAALFREKCGHQLLVALVGDSLLEPFWPTGTGCARGFLAAFDTVWMVRGWAQGKTHLEILAEREGLYRLLPQTTTENISKNFDQYTIDPVTRYPNLNSSCVKPHQVRHLFIDGQQDSCPLERVGPTRSSVNLSRRESDIRPSRLLTWCQKQTQGYRGVDVTNLTSSWKSGLALCALIHRLRPDLIDFDSLNEKDSAKNNQLAFDIAEHEFGIQPVTTGNEMALDQDPDKLMMVLYISKLYEMFRNSPASITGRLETDENNEANSSESAHSVYNLMNRTQPKKRIPKDNGKLEENDPMNKRRRKGSTYLEELSCQSAPPAGDGGEQNKVRSMATQLLAKFEENASPGSSLRNKCIVRKEFPQNLGGSDTCHFCSKRVYVMERLSAEGHFFHRECFRCDVCSSTLRLGGHAYDSQHGKFYCKPHYSQRRSSLQSSSKFLRRMVNSFHKIIEIVTWCVYIFIQYMLYSTPLALPLILVRHFSHENATEKEEPIIEEANFDFNVIEPPQVSHDGPKLPPDSPNQNPSMGKEAPPVTKVPQLEEAVGPKKRLTLSLSEKQKLLDWNLVTPEEARSPGGGDPSKHSKPGDQILPLPQVEAEPVPAQAQPAPSMFQIWANAFRRSFGVPGTTTDSNTVVTRRNNNGPTKPRPLSDGAFSFSSLFGATAQSQEAEPVGVGQKSQPTPHPCKASMGDRPADLPMLLDQVSLGSNKSVGSFTTDNMASLPPRKLNFFSYIRLNKREGPESVGAGVLEKDIRTILSNIRNEGQGSGGFDEQRRRQEETVIQQDKREQLKRLHRAQVIQRQLEEVGEKQKNLEERGVTIEKVLRGESPGDGLSDEHELLQMWFKLVLEKNRLARYEEELVIFAQELELEDRQSQLQRDLQCRMSINDSRKSSSELAEEQEMLTEIMKVVERRDTLVSQLEEQRLQERAEDRDPESLILSRGYQFHWT